MFSVPGVSKDVFSLELLKLLDCRFKVYFFQDSASLFQHSQGKRSQGWFCDCKVQFSRNSNNYPGWFSVRIAGYWNSALCPRRPLSRTLSLQRSRGGDQGPLQAHSDSAPPTLRSKTTGPFLHLERRHSSGPLCFLNPLFIQTHHCPHQHHCERPLSAYAGNSENGTEDGVEAAIELSGSSHEGEHLEDSLKLNSKSQLPPPRPPPPRLMPHRRPAPPPPTTAATTRPKSMPVATMPAKPPQSSKRRPAPQPPKGARHNVATKASNSPDPLPSYPPPPRPKKLDLEAQRCHIAMEDETIAEALSRAKLPSRRPPPSDDIETNRDNLCAPQARGRQRLSDMSMSTSSSDSLDYSSSPAFPPGLTGSPPQHLNHQDEAEDSSEYDENDDEDEEEDYGVGLETDLEMRLRQSSKSQRKRISVSLGGGSLILPKALKGRFQKVSGMLSSLVTPERRIIKKITELSQDRNSYFGSLVQDYIGFVQENRGCHMSGMDFLQTLRQFMTQMKAYLCQSSELDPPLESLIPEDQIGKWTEHIVGWYTTHVPTSVGTCVVFHLTLQVKILQWLILSQLHMGEDKDHRWMVKHNLLEQQHRLMWQV